MTRESFRSSGLTIMLFLAVAAMLILSGCTSATQDVIDTRARDAYLQAYMAGIEQHLAGQGYFNNGTQAWEAGDYRTAIAGYANASLNYSAAAKDYGIMAGYARSEKEKEFAGSLRGCAFNLSQASDLFMNAAIALGKDDSNAAYDAFSRGQASVDASEALLNRSIAATPEWIIELALS